MRPPSSLALAACTACTVPNPAFDIDATAGTTAATTSPGPTTNSPTTHSTDEPTATTLAPTSTTSTPTTGPVEPGTTTDTTGTTTDTDGGSSTGDSDGDPRSCWPQQHAGWPLAGAELLVLDVEPTDPFISPDGLRLYYIALTERVPFLSTRKSRDIPFANGAPLVVWNSDPKYAAAYPVVTLGEAEMLMANNDDIAFSLYTPQNPDKYSKPAAIAGPNTADPEQHVTVSADGTLLIVSRLDGPPMLPFFPTKSPRFHQFTRANPQPGAPFTGDDLVTPITAPLQFAICPVLSPDGLHLFFGGTDAAVLDENNANDVVSIYYTRRDAPDAPWIPAQRIAIANDGVTCPSSVTADGCELAYHQFHLKAGDYRMFLARRPL